VNTTSRLEWNAALGTSCKCIINNNGPNEVPADVPKSDSNHSPTLPSIFILAVLSLRKLSICRNNLPVIPKSLPILTNKCFLFTLPNASEKCLFTLLNTPTSGATKHREQLNSTENYGRSCLTPRTELSKSTSLWFYYHQRTVSLRDFFWSVSSTSSIGCKIKFDCSVLPQLPVSTFSRLLQIVVQAVTV